MKASRAFHFENPFGRKPGAALLVLAALLWLGPSPVVAKGHSAQGTPPKDPAFGAFLPIPLQMASLGIQSLDGKKAEDFVLPTLDGKTLRLSDFRGKVVFLNFWASWCPACRIEMPDMEALHRRFKGRDFAVLSVAVDTTGRKKVSPFVKEFGLTFPVLLDPKNKIMDRYRVTLIPTTFLIGPGGELLGKVIGPKDWDGKRATRLFESLVRAAGSPTPRVSSSTQASPQVSPTRDIEAASGR